MIIDTMNHSEILKEILKDKEEINEHFGKHYKTCFKRQVLKATKFPFVPSPLHFTSSRRNKYFIYIVARKRSEWKTNRYYYVCYSGNKAYMYDSYINTLLIFTPHFFSRYRERFIKNNQIITEQVIERFFKHNLVISCKVRKCDNTFIGTCEDGVAFGIFENGFAIIKTFISREMKYENQKELCNDLEKRREELWEQIA